MECIPKSKVLQHHPDTLTVVRKEFDLHKPGMMKESIRILKEWVQQQRHFKKKDFSDTYLETAIITSKGSLERAKKQLDRMCTLRTLLPQYFRVRNLKTDFGVLFDVITPVILPKLTPEYHRVYILKVNENVKLLKDYVDYFIFLFIIADYLRMYDYCQGFIAVMDFTDVNLADVLPNLNIITIKEMFSIFIEAYGLRFKGLYIYTPSKLVDTFVSITKQVVSPKIGDRIRTYKTLDNISDIIPKQILPKDYGGEEKPMREIFEDWLEVLSSEDYLNYLTELGEAGSDESCRPTDKFNAEYAGMPGSFRMLTVD